MNALSFLSSSCIRFHDLKPPLILIKIEVVNKICLALVKDVSCFALIKKNI